MLKHVFEPFGVVLDGFWAIWKFCVLGRFGACERLYRGFNRGPYSEKSKNFKSLKNDPRWPKMMKKNSKTYKNMFLHRFEWFWMVFGPLEKIRQKNVTKILRLIDCAAKIVDIIYGWPLIRNSWKQQHPNITIRLLIT